MDKPILALFMAGILVMPLLGQTAHKITDINKKVVGKWWSSDGNSYIEFHANGACSEGDLWSDGKWHTEDGKLGAWEKGESFICSHGALTLVGPNVLTRDYGMGGDTARYYRGLQPPPKTSHTLTLAVAQRVLSQQIDMQTANNSLMTCHACYDPDDKEDNDQAPLVTTYAPPLGQFLTTHGYIRTSGGQQVFTAKAKRSRYYEVDQGFAGFRFASFKNSKILTNKIEDPSHVPIEYDFVPTDLTMGLFGKTKKINSFASFSYANATWTVCIACRQ